MPDTTSRALDVLLLLTRANSSASAALDPALSRVGLWLADLSLLSTVADAGEVGLHRDELARSLHTSPSETVRRIRPLEKLNWLRRSNEGMIVLTDAGHAVVAEGSGLATNRAEALLAEVFDPNELDTLCRMLSTLVTAR